MPAKKVREKFGVGDSTIRKWANEGLVRVIRSIGGKRFYDVSSLFT